MTITSITPDLLLANAAERLRATRPDLSRRLELSDPRELRKVKAELAAAEGAGRGNASLVVVVINRFQMADWIRETCRFVLGIPAGRAESWRRSFTRTVYLAGRPDNLQERFAFDHVAADGSAAWAGPAADQSTATLRKLLKSFSGLREPDVWTPKIVEVPPAHSGGAPARPAVHRDLYVATAKLTIADVLVQLNHLIAEAAMDGIIAPGDRLTLRRVPRLTGLNARFAALRIDTDVHRPDELQAYAALTEEDEQSEQRKEEQRRESEAR